MTQHGDTWTRRELIMQVIRVMYDEALEASVITGPRSLYRLLISIDADAHEPDEQVGQVDELTLHAIARKVSSLLILRERWSVELECIDAEVRDERARAKVAKKWRPEEDPFAGDVYTSSDVLASAHERQVDALLRQREEIQDGHAVEAELRAAFSVAGLNPMEVSQQNDMEFERAGQRRVQRRAG